MPNPRALLRRRDSILSTRKITKTMEMVSTAQLSRAQHAALAARPYAQKLREVIGALAAASSGQLTHPLLEARSPSRKAVVVVLTSDRGLCAAFNANVLRRLQQLRAELTARGTQIEFIVQGKKGLAALRFRGLTAAKAYTLVSTKPTYARAEEIGDALIRRFAARDIDEAHVVYSAFRGMTSQVPQVDQLLPLSGVAAAPAAGAKAHAPGMGFIYHPGPERILHELLPLMVKVTLFAALLDSCAGEHAARRVAMKNATDAADDMIRTLTQGYNRARQTKITMEISEIVGGAEAL